MKVLDFSRYLSEVKIMIFLKKINSTVFSNKHSYRQKNH